MLQRYVPSNVRLAPSAECAANPSTDECSLVAATAYFSEHLSEACTWYSGLAGREVLSHTDPHGGAGTYYAAVFTLSGADTSYQLIARPHDDTSRRWSPASRSRARSARATGRSTRWRCLRACGASCCR